MIIQNYVVSFRDGAEVKLSSIRGDSSISWKEFVDLQSKVSERTNEQTYAENVIVYAACESLNLKIRMFTASDSEPEVFAPKNQKCPLDVDIIILYQSLHYVAAVPQATVDALSADGAPVTSGEEEKDGHMGWGYPSSDDSAESDFKQIR